MPAMHINVSRNTLPGHEQRLEKNYQMTETKIVC